MLQPIHIYKRWPMPDDFTRLFMSSLNLSFAQLRSQLKNYEVEYLDGTAQECSLKELTRRAQACDVILINAYSSVGALNVEANLRHIIDTCSGKPIIMGGHHATFYDFQWLGRGAHFIVRNEGEETIVELLDAIFNGGSYSGIKGLSWRGKDRKFYRNPARELIADLDKLPIPDWSIFNRELYDLPLPNKGLATSIESSRGCGHKCGFCSASKMWGHTQRFKSANRVLEELRFLRSKGFGKLFFVDDNFGADPKRDIEIYKGMLREKMDFNFMVFMRSDTVVNSSEAIKLAYKAGLRIVLLGIESPSKDMLENCNKNSDFEKSKKAVEILRANGIFIAGFFMTGYMDEKEEDTDLVFNIADTMSDYPFIAIFEPRMGTRDFDRAMKTFDVPGGDMFYHNTSRFIPSKVHILPKYRSFYRKYLLHPKQISKLLIGTPTQKLWFRGLYWKMMKSVLSISLVKISHPWEMVRDIYE